MAVGFLVPSLAIFGGRAGHNICLNLFHRKPQEACFSTSQHKNSCKKIVTTGAVAEVSFVIEIVHRSGG